MHHRGSALGAQEEEPLCSPRYKIFSDVLFNFKVDVHVHLFLTDLCYTAYFVMGTSR